jgi:hypothetical protein
MCFVAFLSNAVAGSAILRISQKHQYTKKPHAAAHLDKLQLAAVVA